MDALHWPFLIAITALGVAGSIWALWGEPRKTLRGRVRWALEGLLLSALTVGSAWVHAGA